MEKPKIIMKKDKIKVLYNNNKKVKGLKASDFVVKDENGKEIPNAIIELGNDEFGLKI